VLRPGEAAWNTDTDRAHMGDGETAGGLPQAAAADLVSLATAASVAALDTRVDDLETEIDTKATTAALDAAVAALKGGVSTSYDTLSEIVAVLTNMGAVTKSAIETGSAVSLTSDTGANVTYIDLVEAGDYDVWGMVHFKGGSTTTVGYLLCSISGSSATLNTAAERVAAQYYFGFAPFAGVSFISVPVQEFRITASANQRLYLVSQAGFGTSTLSAYGVLYARRRKAA